MPSISPDGFFFQLEPTADLYEIYFGLLDRFPAGLAALGGNDTVIGSVGEDIIYGNIGDDNLSGGDAIDAIFGNEGNDVLTGDGDNDILLGGPGNDSLDGGLGSDDLNGNEGDDTLTGGAGDDVLRGGKENDSINGGEGDDILVGDLGRDILTGEAGEDIFALRRSEAVSNPDLATIVTDFNPLEDFIGISDGLTVDSLSLESIATNNFAAVTAIKLTETGEVLAVLPTVTADDLRDRITEFDITPLDPDDPSYVTYSEPKVHQVSETESVILTEGSDGSQFVSRIRENDTSVHPESIRYVPSSEDLTNGVIPFTVFASQRGERLEVKFDNVDKSTILEARDDSVVLIEKSGDVEQEITTLELSPEDAAVLQEVATFEGDILVPDFNISDAESDIQDSATQSDTTATQDSSSTEPDVDLTNTETTQPTDLELFENSLKCDAVRNFCKGIGIMGDTAGLMGATAAVAGVVTGGTSLAVAAPLGAISMAAKAFNTVACLPLVGTDKDLAASIFSVSPFGQILKGTFGSLGNSTLKFLNRTRLGSTSADMLGKQAVSYGVKGIQAELRGFAEVFDDVAAQQINNALTKTGIALGEKSLNFGSSAVRLYDRFFSQPKPSSQSFMDGFRSKLGIDMCNASPVNPGVCGEPQTLTGGQGTSSQTYNLGTSSGTVTIAYEMCPNPDKMDVFYGNELVASTGGLVSGSNIMQVPVDGSSNSLTVQMSAPNPGTGWAYVVYCPGQEVPQNIGQLRDCN